MHVQPPTIKRKNKLKRRLPIDDLWRGGQNLTHSKQSDAGVGNEKKKRRQATGREKLAWGSGGKPKVVDTGPGKGPTRFWNEKKSELVPKERTDVEDKARRGRRAVFSQGLLKKKQFIQQKKGRREAA